MRTRSPEVDIGVEVELCFAGGLSATFSARLDRESDDLDSWVRIVGDKGTLQISNPYSPHMGHTISLLVAGTSLVETPDLMPTYVYQLREVVQAVRGGIAIRTPVQDGVKRHQVIDAIYRAGGLRVRGDTTWR